MSDIKIPPESVRAQAASFLQEVDESRHLDPDTHQLLVMASLLGPRDRAALSQIIRRAGEIYESDGEETALAVLDQIEAIISGRRIDG